ncbi:MAG TPA: hypothetical protein PL059_13405 [Spirochaetota bacterium]|nr:hypothetical protein [Spirochaetota bacterium]HOM10984.1 hypothetical protein [Spirochaetota bacterium]HPP50956.1 hypothetical protein [Spirochaetota bacterium]HXK64713.1 hypothetical protein [Spirochaetota bacterium]
MENTNRLYQYLLQKKKSFAYVSDEGIDGITIMIHARPGKSKGWKSSYEVLQGKLNGALQT